MQLVRHRLRELYLNCLLMNSKLIISCFLSCLYFTVNAQSKSMNRKIEYHQTGRSGSLEIKSCLYVYNEGSFYTYAFDYSNPNRDEDPSSSEVMDDRTYYIRYSIEKDSIYELAYMKSLHPGGILLGEKRETIAWELMDSTKVINGHFCKFARASFRGREYLVWYDPLIPINLGPWKLHGLPGAVIYVSDIENDHSFEAMTFDEISDEELGNIMRQPSLPIVGREEYRTHRDSTFKAIIENTKARSGSGVTYNLKVTYHELELD